MSPCQWCGCLHGAVCPKVKAIEYFPDGSIKSVEFHPPAPLWSEPDDGGYVILPPKAGALT